MIKLSVRDSSLLLFIGFGGGQELFVWYVHARRNMYVFQYSVPSRAVRNDVFFV